MKTEPSVFAFGDFLKHPQRLASWEGVRNYQARNFMRDQFKLGDLAAIYHSRCETPEIVGVAQVAKEAYPDPTALDTKSPYFDPKSLEGQKSRWVMVDLVAIALLDHPVSLKEIKATASLKTMLVARPGQRLSVQPVTPKEWEMVMALGRPRDLPRISHD